jgi:hypothetical protein
MKRTPNARGDRDSDRDAYTFTSSTEDTTHQTYRHAPATRAVDACVVAVNNHAPATRASRCLSPFRSESVVTINQVCGCAISWLKNCNASRRTA